MTRLQPLACPTACFFIVAENCRIFNLYLHFLSQNKAFLTAVGLSGHPLCRLDHKKDGRPALTNEGGLIYNAPIRKALIS